MTLTETTHPLCMRVPWCSRYVGLTYDYSIENNTKFGQKAKFSGSLVLVLLQLGVEAYCSA